MRALDIQKRGIILGLHILMVMMVLGSLSMTAVASSETENTLFAMGNEAYVKGDYPQAVTYYQSAINEGGYSASLLFNLANAYYRSGDVGQAILNYERASYLDPSNADIKANRALARKDFGLVAPSEPVWKNFFSGLSLNNWTWLASFSLAALSLLMLLRGLFYRRMKVPAFSILGGIFLILLITGVMGTGIGYQNLNMAVVTAENTRLRVSPFDSAQDGGPVQDGKMVHLGKSYKNYVFVEQSNGKSGWVLKDAVSAVLPCGGLQDIQTRFTRSMVRKPIADGAEKNNQT